MNRKAKLTLAGVGFLGANGALIPTVNNSFSLPDFSLSTLGGGINHLIGSSRKNYESPKLALSNTKTATPSIDLDSSKSNLQTPKLHLEEQGEVLQSTISQLSPEKNTSISSIERINQEIGREGRVQGIGQQLESKYLEQFKAQLEGTEEKQQQHLKAFQEVKEIIHSSPQKPEPSVQRSRGKREVVQEKEPLTQLQRDALYRMFNLHTRLKIESAKLSSQLEREFFNGLKELLKPESPSALKSHFPTAKEIQVALRDISWNGKAIKTQKGRRKGSTQFYSANSWGKWSENPFRHFFQESEFSGAISQQQKLAQKAELAEQMQLRMQSGYRGQFLHQYEANMKRIQKQKASTGSHIEHKIASKLLEYMGQGLKST